MTTYVLVHGAWHGSWCWQRVRRALQLQGHEVFTPTLTGVGERAHLLSPAVNLDTHINDVVNLIRMEALNDVVLCGHSYGGCVIRGVADRIGERIARLVYLDAFVLENGESLHGVLPPEQVKAQIETAQQHGDGWKVAPIPAAVFGVNPADVAWVDSQCTMQSLATFQQPLVLRSEPAIPTTHVLATGWSHSPFPLFHERAKAKGWQAIAISCGHDVMLDMPDELVRILLA